MPFSLNDLTAALDEAAIRRTRRLQPAGGPGDKILPPTYPPDQSGKPPRHVYEQRRVDGELKDCVLLDSVASQANRLEEVLVSAVREDGLALPMLEVDFAGTDIADLGRISAMEAPHRVFDAIIRDSRHEGTPFGDSALGKALKQARTDRATTMLENAPAALLFGAWNSTGEGGGLGAKFPRCITSEIVGIDAAQGQTVGSRLDPLGTSRDVTVYVDENRNWALDPKDLDTKNPRQVRPSEINHSNVMPSVEPRGVTLDHARHSAVLTLAGLRRLRFPDNDGAHTAERDRAGRAVLAAMGLLALTRQDRAGYALRSRCDLVPEEPGTFELVRRDGSVEPLDLDADSARTLYDDAVAEARRAGFAWSPNPVRLTPEDRLVELVRKSRDKALAGQAEPGDG